MESLCPLCQEIKKTKIWTEARTGNYSFTYRQCCSCGFVFLDPRPGEEEILHYYPRDYVNLMNNPSLTRQRLSRLGQGKMFFLAAGLSPFCLLLSLAMAMFDRGDTIEAYFRLEDV